MPGQNIGVIYLSTLRARIQSKIPAYLETEMRKMIPGSHVSVRQDYRRGCRQPYRSSWDCARDRMLGSCSSDQFHRLGTCRGPTTHVDITGGSGVSYSVAPECPLCTVCVNCLQYCAPHRYVAPYTLNSPLEHASSPTLQANLFLLLLCWYPPQQFLQHILKQQKVSMVI